MALIQNLVARLTLDSSAFDRNSRRSAQSMRGLQSQTLALQRTVVGLAGAYIGARGLVSALTSVTRAAMAAEESDNLFRVSMGQTARQARQWSEDLSEALGLNEYQVRQSVGTFNVMFESMDVGARQAYAMAKGLTQLAYDMASFYNLRPEETFRKLQAGITGEVEPLKRLGIVVNETRTKQYALTQGMIDQNQTLSESQKILARYGLIMRDTRKAQGDLERTADSATNVQRRLNAQWEKFKVELGKLTLPLITDAMTGLTKAVEGLNRALQDVEKTRGRIAASMPLAGLTKEEALSLNRALPKSAVGNLGYDFYAQQPEIEQEFQAGSAYRERLIAAYRRSAVVQARVRAGIDAQVGARPPGGGGADTGVMFGPQGLTPLDLDTYGQKIKVYLGQEKDAHIRTMTDILQARRALAADMDRTSLASWRVRRQVLEDERQQWIEELGGRSDLIDAWYDEQRDKLGIARGKAVGGIFGGMRAGVAEMNRELLTTGEIFADLTRQARDGFVGAINDAIFRSQDLGDSLRRVALSLLEYGLTENVLKPAATTFFGSLFGSATVQHAGGLAGTGPQRPVPWGLFAGAPRLHNGLASDEFPAILQRGERVIPKNGGGGNTKIVIQNNGSPVTARLLYERFDATFNERVIAVMLDDENTGGPYSRQVGRG